MVGLMIETIKIRCVRLFVHSLAPSFTSGRGGEGLGYYWGLLQRHELVGIGKGEKALNINHLFSAILRYHYRLLAPPTKKFYKYQYQDLLDKQAVDMGE
jgi:hypothetical protein